MLLTFTLKSITDAKTRKGETKLILQAMEDDIPAVYIFPKQVASFSALGRIVGETVTVEGYTDLYGKYQPKGSFKAQTFWDSEESYKASISQEAEDRRKAFEARERIDTDIPEGTLVIVPQEYQDLTDCRYLLATRTLMKAELSAFFITLEQSGDLSPVEFQDALSLFDGLSCVPTVLLHPRIESDDNSWDDTSASSSRCHITVGVETVFSHQSAEELA